MQLRKWGEGKGRVGAWSEEEAYLRFSPAEGNIKAVLVNT